MKDFLWSFFRRKIEQFTLSVAQWEELLPAVVQLIHLNTATLQPLAACTPPHLLQRSGFLQASAT